VQAAKINCDTRVKQDRRVVPKAPPRGGWKQNRRYALLAAVFGLLLLAYSNSLGALFLMDNAEMIHDNRIHSVTAEHLHRIFTQRYWEGMGDQLYRPVATLSYLFNYAILGNATDPTGYHCFNLALHAVNMLLVYWLGLAIFSEYASAALLTAVWGLHPVLTESVTNIIGRSDMMAAFGVLAALLAHRMALRSSGRRKALWLSALALSLAVGMFSKESAIVALAIVVLWDLAFERDAPWRSRVGSYAAAAVPCIAFLLVRTRVLANQPWMPVRFTENPLVGADFWTARITAVRMIGRYFSLLVWPAALSPDYSYNEVPLFGWATAGQGWSALFAITGCLAAVALAIYSWRRNRALFFFLAFFFAALAPVSNVFILIGTIMGERLVYLPAVGFAGCVVCAVRAIEPRLRARPAYRTALFAALIVVAVVFAIRTHVRNSDWLDEQRFWASARDAAPGSYKTVLNAALYRPLVTEQNVSGAIREVDSALAILDRLPDVQSNAMAYRRAGTFYRVLGDAVAARNQTSGSSPAESWYRKSLSALLRCEKIELAQDEMDRRFNAQLGKTTVASAMEESFRELGRTYIRLRDVPQAIAAFERGRLLGADPELLEDLASVYRAKGELRSAALALVEALAVDGTRVRLMSPLVDLYSAVDPGGCAVTREGGAPALNLACPLVHNDICAASANVAGVYTRRGQQWEAEAIRRTAITDLGCAAPVPNR
jgi:protein O-mannosyl-transferase